jgi:hypothetical protein
MAIAPQNFRRDPPDIEFAGEVGRGLARLDIS